MSRYSVLRAALAHDLASTLSDLRADGWRIFKEPSECAEYLSRAENYDACAATVRGVRRACAEHFRERDFQGFEISPYECDFPAGYELIR